MVSSAPLKPHTSYFGCGPNLHLHCQTPNCRMWSGAMLGNRYLQGCSALCHTDALEEWSLKRLQGKNPTPTIYFQHAMSPKMRKDWLDQFQTVLRLPCTAFTQGSLITHPHTIWHVPGRTMICNTLVMLAPGGQQHKLLYISKLLWMLVQTTFWMWACIYVQACWSDTYTLHPVLDKEILPPLRMSSSPCIGRHSNASDIAFTSVSYCFSVLSNPILHYHHTCARAYQIRGAACDHRTGPTPRCQLPDIEQSLRGFLINASMWGWAAKGAVQKEELNNMSSRCSQKIIPGLITWI